MASGSEPSRQAIALAHRHGWDEDPVAGVAYALLGASLVSQGQLDQAGPWLDHAARTLRSSADPAAAMSLFYARSLVELVRRRNDEALADLRVVERLADTLVTPHPLATTTRLRVLETLLRLGQAERVEATLAGLDERERRSPQMLIGEALLRLTQGDPRAATTALTPITHGSVPQDRLHLLVTALLLEAIALDQLGERDPAGRALERALDLAEPDRMLLSFLLYPAPELLARHSAQHTAHAALIADIVSQLTGTRGGAAPSSEAGSLREPLTRAETRVLRFMPTLLTVPEIADQLGLSVNTVRTHMRHLYDKLEAHRRHDVIERARALGLLAPSPTAH